MTYKIKRRASLKDIPDILRIDGSSFYESKNKLFAIYNTKWSIRSNQIIMAYNIAGRLVGYIAYYDPRKEKCNPIWLKIIQSIVGLFLDKKLKAKTDDYLKIYTSLENVGRLFYENPIIGHSVAVDPIYRNQGIYREMLRLINFKEITFITDTDKTYKAHEKIGFKKLLTVNLKHPFKMKYYIMGS